ncbi:PREDICTED: olfactory receptor 2H1-like [Branchiostoma belcheri]|uniref:Olfactory receptor 2H1-like n=1 Tax=Branchiostoma belcheri TaxID=7741 RepID=A0A6P4Y6Q3_BRABE|nr:PREDICTED: olfactory receptor 2H1-like [Branchiostoma belcheri]
MMEARPTLEFATDFPESDFNSNYSSMNGSMPMIFGTSPLEQALQVTYVTLSYLATLGGNIGVLVVILSYKRLRKPRYYVHCSLACCDIFITTVCIPTVIVNLLYRVNDLGWVWCQVHSAVYMTMSACTLFNLAIMAMDRYYVICWALNYHNVVTTSRVLSLITAAWLTSILSVAVYQIMSRFADPNQYVPDLLLCTPRVTTDWASLRYQLPMLCVASALTISSFAVIIFSYVKVYQQASRQHSLIKSQNEGDDVKFLETKAVKTITTHSIIFLIFFVSWSLHGITKLLLENWTFPSNALKAANRTFLLVFLTIPCYSNPIVYGFCNAEIQEAFLDMIKRIRTKGNDVFIGQGTANSYRQGRAKSYSDEQDENQGCQEAEQV